MKRAIIVATLVIFFSFIAIASYAYAVDGISAGIGRTEQEHRGGMNVLVEAYGRDDKGGPSELLGLDAGPSYLKMAPVNAWIKIKPALLNVGKIKEIKTNVGPDMEIIYDENKGVFWLDCQKLGVGSYFVTMTCRHVGGKATYQVVFLVFKREFVTSDEIGFQLNIIDPEKTVTTKSSKTMGALSGFILVDGTGIIPGKVPIVSDDSVATIRILDQSNQPSPGTFTIKIEGPGGTREGKVKINGKNALIGDKQISLQTDNTFVIDSIPVGSTVTVSSEEKKAVITRIFSQPAQVEKIDLQK
jgi:hypothetical protein